VIKAANTRSLAVEFADPLVMPERPAGDAVNEVVRKTIPGKPIRVQSAYWRRSERSDPYAGVRVAAD
jgi:hypothetical protein